MKTDQSPPPVEQIFQLVLGYMPAMALNIVSRLGVADQIAREPKAISDLEFASAGFKLSPITATKSPLSVIENGCCLTR